MTTNRMTIDNLDIKAHERYALDQQKLDLRYIDEATLIHPHSEILGVSSIYSSKWEELFEIHKRNISWASFCPPPRYNLQSNRFFTYCIFPSIAVEEERDKEDEKEREDQEENSEEERKRDRAASLLEKILSAKKRGAKPADLFEREKTDLIDLLESIKYLNKLLLQINGRKLQYQKG